MGLSLKSTSSKVLASAALLAAAAGVAGMGTYGGFTASTSASAAVKAGTVKLRRRRCRWRGNRLSVAASGAIPGDTVQRAVTLTNSGDQNLTAITLTTAAAPSSKLDTDAVNGLQMQIDACSTVPWTEAGTSPSFTYTCSGNHHRGPGFPAVVGTKMPLVGLDVRDCCEDRLPPGHADGSDGRRQHVPGPDQHHRASPSTPSSAPAAQASNATHQERTGSPGRTELLALAALSTPAEGTDP